jgi:DNA-binding CsgD family transcriptional regulator
MRLVCILILLLASKAVMAQSNVLGLPPITYFSRAEYQGGTQTWDFAQDQAGRILAANNEGLLVHDGASWQKYPIANGTCVRSVAIADNGDIYVGGQGEMGFFKANDAGKLVYQSLSAKIPAKERQFADVWDIIMTKDSGMFFRSDDQVFRWHRGEMTTCTFSKKTFFLGSYLGKPLLQDNQLGLHIFENGHFVALNKTASIPGQLTACLELGGGNYTLVTLRNGLFNLNNGIVTPIKTVIDPFLASKQLFAASLMANGMLALGTTQGGTVLLDAQYKPVHWIQKKDGLIRNNVLSIFCDRSQNLFLGLDNGLAYVEVSAPLYWLQPDQENSGGGYAATVFDQNLYLGTSTGLYKKDLKLANNPFAANGCQLVAETKGQVWNLDTLNDQLWMGHHEGAFKLRPTFQRITQTAGVWKFIHFGGGQAVMGHYNGISQLNTNPSAAGSKQLNGLNESCRVMEMGADGHVWVSHPYRGVFKIDPTLDTDTIKFQTLGAENGLPTQLNNYVFKLGSDVYFGTEKGVYRYEKDRFAPADVLNQLINGVGRIRLLKEDLLGNIWYCQGNDVGVLWVSGSSLNEKTPKQSFPNLAQQLVGGFESMFPLSDSTILFGTEQGFSLLDLRRLARAKGSMEILISTVSLGLNNEQVLLDRFSTANEIELPYQKKNLHIAFAAPVFGGIGSVEYSTKLFGLENEWSAWGIKSDRDFASLAPGKYRLLIKARNKSGVESAIKSFEININAPWYATLFAKFIYFGLCLLILSFVFRKQKKKHEAEKDQLTEDHRQKQEAQQLIVVETEQALEETEQALEETEQALEETEQALVQTEQALVLLQNEKLASEVAHQNKELALATMHLVQKGNMITALQTDLKEVKDRIAERSIKDDLQRIIMRLQIDENADQDWEQFAMRFDKVHGDFIKKLSVKYPQLTPYDHRLCAFLFLDLSTKEIANMLNISVRGVETSRHRLRKKLNISNDMNLTVFMKEI